MSWVRPGVRTIAGILGSALLLNLYARGGPGFALGFVALIPWLLALDHSKGLGASVRSGWLMSIAFVLAVMPWFGVAIGEFSGLGGTVGVAILLVAAPLLQPQFLVFALVRHWTGQRYGPWLRALAGVSAWVASEWLLPKLLGDSLGHGLYPSGHLRQAADIAGVAGLSAALIAVNEALALAWTRRREGVSPLIAPLCAAAMLPLCMYAYGWLTLAMQDVGESNSERLRIGLVQSNIYNYERLREQIGAFGVVRQVLDTHFALSRQATAGGDVDALLWSETVYPTTFGHPKSEAGAELDRELLAFVKASGRPLVFGTYDIDSGGEYNAAAFVEPNAGLIGFYRKTKAFPLTEHVPAWLDGPSFRRWFPWAGTWSEGNGARVFPLRLADGREIPVLPLICLDDVDSALGIEGARQGARAILTMSNDSWFSAHPQGADLHLAVAAFRSIETRLPQFRVTANGRSAVIDAMGQVLAESPVGEPAALQASVALTDMGTTRVMRMGHWLGPVSLAFLCLLAAHSLSPSLRRRRARAGSGGDAAREVEAPVMRMPAVWRTAAFVMQLVAWAGLAWLAGTVLTGVGSETKPLMLLQRFAFVALAPQLAAWAMGRAFTTTLRSEFAACLFAQAPRWRLLQRFVQARMEAPRGRLDHPALKFLLFPLLPALPAFRLHQIIAYGGTFGEAYTYGLKAWLLALLIWWASWVVGLVLFAAGVRLLVEFANVAALALRQGETLLWRRRLETLARVLYFLALPLWLLDRLLSS